MALHCLSSTCLFLKTYEESQTWKVLLTFRALGPGNSPVGIELQMATPTLSSDAEMEGLWRGAQLGSHRPFSSC